MGTTGDAADVTLANELANSTVFTLDGAPVTDGSFSLAEGTADITATATVDFGFEGASDASQDGSVDLAGMGIQLTQVVAPAVQP